MVQPVNVLLIDCCGRGQLSARVAAILKASAIDNSLCHNFAELDPESQHNFINNLDDSSSLVVLLVSNRQALPNTRRFIRATKDRNSNAEIIVLSEECRERDV